MEKHIAYKNGSIRTPQGLLVAFFDFGRNVVVIDGVAEEIQCIDLEHAMDLVGQYIA